MQTHCEQLHEDFVEARRFWRLRTCETLKSASGELFDPAADDAMLQQAMDFGQDDEEKFEPLDQDLNDVVAPREPYVASSNQPTTPPAEEVKAR